MDYFDVMRGSIGCSYSGSPTINMDTPEEVAEQ
jgi:hypothetical protein